MRCLQVNLGRSKAAHDLVYSTIKQKNIDLVISKPNIKISENKNEVAVYIVNKNMGITGHKKGEGFVKLEFTKFDLYGCYCSPNITMAHFQNYIDRVMTAATNSKEAIIAGDLNSKSPL